VELSWLVQQGGSMRKLKLTNMVLGSLVLMWFTSVLSTVCAADNQSSLNDTEHAFVARAMSDNAAQIAMAKLALQKSKNPQIVELANIIIAERVALDQQLANLAAGSIDRIAIEQAALNSARMTALQSLNGDAFDKTFAGLLIRDHYQIIPAYEAVKMDATHDALWSCVHDAVPALRGNLAVALSFLRSENWKPATHRQQVALTTDTDSHANKVPVYWESLSIVAAPW
jgi:putative membrane protein